MALSLQLLHRDDFEARTLRALVGGACAGVLAALGSRAGLPLDGTWLTLVCAALAAVKPLAGHGVALRMALVVLPLFPFFFEGPTPLPEGFSAAIAAALLTWVGQGREDAAPPAQVALNAATAGVLVPLGLYVQQVLQARLPGADSGLVASLVGSLVVALFFSIGTLPGHVRAHLDAVLARGGALESTLEGEARQLASRALGLYRQCKALALKLPASPGRSELLGTLASMAREAFSLAESHAALETQLRAVVLNDVDAQVQDLRARAESTQDEVARRQLELAASSLGEELNHMEALGRRRERMLAQLHAQVALLERARVSLVGAQGGELGDKGAQAAALARRLTSLGQDASPPSEPQPAAPSRVAGG